MNPELEYFVQLYRASKELIELDQRSDAWEKLNSEINAYLIRIKSDVSPIEFREAIALKYRKMNEATKRGRQNELTHDI